MVEEISTPAPSRQAIRAFVNLMKTNLGYNPEGKARFHAQATTILKALADKLGYASDQYEVRSNQGGIAVSGEVILHSDELYVQFSQSCLSTLMPKFMWRSCQGREDYTGGPNQWAEWAELFDLDALASKMRSHVRKS
jgi:hypothetical protein